MRAASCESGHLFRAGDDPQRRLHDGHQERSGDPLARHVSDRDAGAATAEVKEIVVVAADEPRAGA